MSLHQCSEGTVDDIASLLTERLPEELASRFINSLNRLIKMLSELKRVGVNLEKVIIFGSIVDPKKNVKKDSDIDVLIVTDRVDIVEILSHKVPYIVRLKKLSNGEVDAHTQLLDVDNGVAWHIITSGVKELNEKIRFITGPCIILKRI